MEIACCAGLLGGLAVLLIGLLLPPPHCSNCGYKLPRFRFPRSFRQAMLGGWTCPNCGAEVGRSGNRIETRAGVGRAVSQPEQSPKKTCPQCAEKIQMDALVCIHCGQKFTEDDIQAARQRAEEQALLDRQAAQEKIIRTQKEAKEQGQRNWSWVLAILGGLLGLVGACLTLLMIFYAFSSEAAEAARTGGPLAVIAPFICTVPVLAIGAGLLFLGLNRLKTLPTASYPTTN